MDATCIKRSPESSRPARPPAGCRNTSWPGTARATSRAGSHGLARADRNDDTVKAYLAGILSDLVPEARNRDRRHVRFPAVEHCLGRLAAPFSLRLAGRVPTC